MTVATEPTAPSEWAPPDEWASYHLEMAERTLDALKGRTLDSGALAAVMGQVQAHAQLAQAYIALTPKEPSR